MCLVTGSMAVSRDLAAVRCRVEKCTHGERLECIAEHGAELAGEEPSEDKWVYCIQETCAKTSNQPPDRAVWCVIVSG
jgi:hypothetical protein